MVYARPARVEKLCGVFIQSGSFFFPLGVKGGRGREEAREEEGWR
jgi:hypothetical protein